MGLPEDFTRLIDSSPKVECSRCHIEMTLRSLLPVTATQKYEALYRCGQCGTDVVREFKPR